MWLQPPPKGWKPRDCSKLSETPEGDPRSVHVISWLCRLSSNIYKCQEAPVKSTKAGEPGVVACACPPLLQEGQFLPLWKVAPDYDLCINPRSLSPPLSPSQPRTLNPASKGEGCWWDAWPGMVLLGAGGMLRVCCLQLGFLRAATIHMFTYRVIISL